MSGPGAQAAPGSPADRAAEFVSVEGGAPAAGASAETLLVTAYVVMWALVAGFVVGTWRAQRLLDSRISELERRLERSASPRAADE